MSSVTTTTPTISRNESHLIPEDYKIHLTGTDAPPTTTTTTTSSSNSSISSIQATNPPNWPTAYHRIPGYRPIDYGRDVESRPNGSSAFERVFLTVMFSGVVLNATAAKVWGATGGKFFPELLRYKIGGEW